MKFYVILLEVPDGIPKSVLIKMKGDLMAEGKTTVFDVSEINYDFLFNSMLEQANREKKEEVVGR